MVNANNKPDYEALLKEAVNRIKDLMMEDDDGYAHKEARKFLERVEEKLNKE